MNRKKIISEKLVKQIIIAAQVLLEFFRTHLRHKKRKKERNHICIRNDFLRSFLLELLYNQEAF